VCAAPGNKTQVLAADLAMGSAASGSRLVAADYRPGRVEVLRSLTRAAGLAIPIVRLDARAPLPFRPLFDAVVLDVPCSGLGTLRRDPDLKWTRVEADLDGLAREELAMLRRASDVVRPGGRLVYATCSSEPEENGAVVDALLAERPAFAIQPVSLGTAGASGLVDDRGCLSTTPFRDGLDAFFAAVLVRHPRA
jgi:16S rRNA (cytosine967-C5)-methyltransferase